MGSILLAPYDGVDGAHLLACAALDAFILADHVEFFDLAVDAGDGAVSGAFCAADALVSNKVGGQFLTDAGGTALFFDMRLVFFAEGFNGGKHRVGRGLSQCAQGGALSGFC